MDHVDVVVAGAGVVGLAIAAALGRQGREVLVLEKEAHFGQGVSSRNSEVIHAGIYYPANSLKAQLCVRGKSLLYDYCQKRRVDFQPCGKLIVATNPDEEGALAEINTRALANGVADLTYWSARQLDKSEPEVRATSALFSPSTGIVSSHGVMDSLTAEIESFGGQLATHCEVQSVSRNSQGFVHACSIEGEAYTFSSRVFINAAGLGAQQLAHLCEFVESSTVPELHLCRGVYFSYSGRQPFSHLIYPVPEKSGAGLGIHATLDLAGQVKFGPDVEYIRELNYDVPQQPTEAYANAIRRYFPGLDVTRMQPAYAGVRPKLQGPSDSVRDFDIQTPVSTGISGFCQLFGIESPGLTASLAIAEYVSNHL